MRHKVLLVGNMRDNQAFITRILKGIDARHPGAVMIPASSSPTTIDFLKSTGLRWRLLSVGRPIHHQVHAIHLFLSTHGATSSHVDELAAQFNIPTQYHYISEEGLNSDYFKTLDGPDAVMTKEE